MKSREPKNRLHTISFIFGWLLTLAPVIVFLPVLLKMVASFGKLGSEDPSAATGATVGIGTMLPAMVVAQILCPLGIVLLGMTFLARARFRRKMAELR